MKNGNDIQTSPDSPAVPSSRKETSMVTFTRSEAAQLPRLTVLLNAMDLDPQGYRAVDGVGFLATTFPLDCDHEMVVEVFGTGKPVDEDFPQIEDRGPVVAS